jgi:hypothetical protein
MISSSSATTKLKQITNEDLLTLWNEMTILPDHMSLRMINYTDGTHALARSSYLSDNIDTILTEPMTTLEMYHYLQRLWLQAYKEE